MKPIRRVFTATDRDAPIAANTGAPFRLAGNHWIILNPFEALAGWLT